MSDPLDQMMTEVLMQRDALIERLHAAEALLLEADAVIEILLGDAFNEHAQKIRAAIENHWQQYPEPQAQ